MNDEAQKMLCKIAKSKINKYKRKKEITPKEFTEVVISQAYVSSNCEPEKKRKMTDLEKIKRLRKKLYD